MRAVLPRGASDAPGESSAVRPGDRLLVPEEGAPHRGVAEGLPLVRRQGRASSAEDHGVGRLDVARHHDGPDTERIEPALAERAAIFHDQPISSLELRPGQSGRIRNADYPCLRQSRATAARRSGGSAGFTMYACTSSMATRAASSPRAE